MKGWLKVEDIQGCPYERTVHCKEHMVTPKRVELAKSEAQGMNVGTTSLSLFLNDFTSAL
jgi:hypothetical protein